MTRDEVLAMKAGRELDNLVCELVMGIKPVEVFDIGAWHIPAGGEGDLDVYVPVPRYSLDIAAAWEVVEKICDTPGPDGDHWIWTLDAEGVDGCYAEVLHPVFREYRTRQADALAMPEAICKAALLAVMGL